MNLTKEDVKKEIWIVNFEKRFPKEIFQVILSFLPSDTNLMQIALVCKDFFDIVRKPSFRARSKFFFPWNELNWKALKGKEAGYAMQSFAVYCEEGTIYTWGGVGNNVTPDNFTPITQSGDRAYGSNDYSFVSTYAETSKSVFVFSEGQECLKEWDKEQRKWAENPPKKPASHEVGSLVNIKDEYLLFFAGSKCTHKLDLTSRVWSPIKTTGDVPKSLSSASTNVWKDPTTGILHVIVFGGRLPELPSKDSSHRNFERATSEQRDDVKKSYSNDIFILNTKTMNWTKVKCHGEVPEGRTKHSTIIVEDRLLIIGGGTNGYIPFGGGNGYNLIMSCSDFYAFNLYTHEWKRIGNFDDDIYGHCTIQVDKDQIAMLGGYLNISRKHDYYLEFMFFLANQINKE